jgi:serine protease Do
MKTILVTTCKISLGIITALPAMLHSQAPGVPIERNHQSLNDSVLIGKASLLKERGQLLTKAQVTAALKKLKPELLDLPPASTTKLEPHTIAERARKALVRVGWFYKCGHCDHWHVNISAGYALTPDGIVVTCHHCISPDQHEMREGYLLATDTEGNALPVSAVLAADKDLDTAIIRVEARNLAPLPLSDLSRPGDAAYCYSDPMNHLGYFSSGMVNRYYWKEESLHADPTKLNGAKHLRLNISTDWAYGSSGAAVLDACANVIGHVSQINALTDDIRSSKSTTGKDAEESGGKETLMVLHEAIPARAVKLLVESMKPTKASR